MGAVTKGLIVGLAVLSTSTLNVDAANKVEQRMAQALIDSNIYSCASAESQVIGKVGTNKETKLVTDVQGLDGMYSLIRYGNTLGYVPYYNVNYLGYLNPVYVDSSKIVTLHEIQLGDLIYENAYDELLRYYTLIPEQIRESFRERGFKIVMMGRDITDLAYANYGGYKKSGDLLRNNLIAACFDYETKLLWLNDEYPRNVIHEMGHFVNDSYNYTSNEVWDSLFDTEAPKVSMYSTRKKTEYFADVFDLYIRDPEALRFISQASYNAMDNCVKDFINRYTLEKELALR